MTEKEHARLVRSARSAVEYAQNVRAYHRRRTERGQKQRETDLAVAMNRIRDAMRPLRSEIGRFPYGLQTEAAAKARWELRTASEALQAERRKLWKMQRRPRTDDD